MNDTTKRFPGKWKKKKPFVSSNKLVTHFIISLWRQIMLACYTVSYWFDKLGTEQSQIVSAGVQDESEILGEKLWLY